MEVLEEASVENFWVFVERRHQAYWDRSHGIKPLDYDPIIASSHFTNVFRELDKGTIFFQQHIPDKTLSSVLWWSVLYRMCNRIEPFRDLGIPKIGYATDWMRKAREYNDSGRPIFTNRHQTRGWRGLKEIRQFLDEQYYLEFAEEISRATSLEKVWQILVIGPGMGRFLAWQVTCDLLESQVINFSENSWVMCGPGPRTCFTMIHGGRIPSNKEILHFAKMLQKNPQTPNLVFPKHITEITLKNIEHAMCEYSKYVWRVWKFTH